MTLRVTEATLPDHFGGCSLSFARLVLEENGVGTALPAEAEALRTRGGRDEQEPQVFPCSLCGRDAYAADLCSDLSTSEEEDAAGWICAECEDATRGEWP
jgi:hypothetical protein